MLDDFERIEGWSAHPSEGVELRISQDSGFSGKGMRLDFDFRGGAGYAIARKAIPLDLPANYEFSFRIRADAPVNDLEFKLIDPTGDNVWWANRRRFEYPREWTRLRTQKRHIQFAWGPRGGGDLERLAQLEIVVTAGTGGRGTVWIDDLAFRPREAPSPYTGTPALTATAGAETARLAMDGDTATAWRAPAGEQALTVDFGRERELGGLVIHWDRHTPAHQYVVETSVDGRAWEGGYAVRFGRGGRAPIYLPESEARYVRLRLLLGPREGYGIREVEVRPVEWSLTPNAFFTSLAAEAPRGTYPRYLAGEQSYWTVVGVNGDTHEATLNADGMLETGLGAPSLEPFLSVEGPPPGDPALPREPGARVITWADATATQSLADGELPIPSVAWDADGLRLTVTAFPEGRPEASTVYARYRVENRGMAARRVVLALALRPFQVNPPWQFLNVGGGVARIRTLEERADGIYADGVRRVVPVTPGGGFTAFRFDDGDPVEHLRFNVWRVLPDATDPRGFASGLLTWPLELPAGGARDVVVAVPLHDASPVARAGDADAAAALAGRLLAQAERGWRAELGRFHLRLPAAAHGERIARTLRSQLAYILVNRDGPSIQPGSRAYDRSWIRDGSLTSAALLRLGHAAEVRAFAEWYAPHQRASGYVPCCVSLRGADPVPEHDSHGQLVYLVAEYHRLTGDSAFLARMWPHVARAAAFIDTLRHQRMTDEYRTPEKRAYFGLLPESISHEGYSAKPMHSYWDQFFALKGLEDAVYVAQVLGRADDAARIAASRDAFRRDLAASLAAAMAMHRINYLPGSVELGDFDATSTTVGVNPLDGLGFLPRKPLELTFERYYRENIRARLDGGAWEAYTPYEWRTVGTFVRLGWKQRAHEAIGLFLRHQRPPAWNHWAEVVFSDPRAPRFIGDMPHTWVGSDFIRSVLDLFAYERAGDSSLVVGAGIPEAWVMAEPGVELGGLRTWYGPLSLRMRGAGDVVRVRVGGGLRVPTGGVVVHSPRDRAVRRATVDGVRVPVAIPGTVTVRRVPAEIVFEY
ncbi:MAG TPA: discoidin domain-containing protein [Longimicrobium sp.]|nr:discoidin domain-containing protein [Longimicrobium sp.]